MSLYFHSLYPNATIWVTILWYHPDCSNGLFMKTGWWALTNGQTVEVFTGDLEDLNQYYYYYAEASDGAVWNGNINVEVTNNAFSQCVWDNSGCNRTVAYSLLDINSYDDFTVNLVPSGYRPPPHTDHGDGWGGHADFSGFADSPFDDAPFDDAPFDDSFDDSFGDGGC